MTPGNLVMGILLAFIGGLSGCITNNTVIIIQQQKVDATALPYSDDDNEDPDCPDNGFELARSNPVGPVDRMGGHRRSHRPRNTLTEASYFRR